MRKAVILTALRVEYMAVRAHLHSIKEVHHPAGNIYETGIFQGEEDDNTWEIGIAEIGMDNDNAASQAERAISFFKPAIIFFVGVAGGFKEKDIKPGDVVIATKVYGYESGKVVKEDFKVRPEDYRPHFKLKEIAKSISRSNDWLRQIPNYFPETIPGVVLGPIAAGNKVITSKDSEIGRLIFNCYNDTIAVGMEGKGFLQAAYTNPDVQALLIRGIPDLLDNKDELDSKGFQEIASKHAEAFAFEILNKTVKKVIKPEPPAPAASDPLDNALLDIRKTVGREKELKQLLDALELEDKKVFIVNGLAGIGKSILVSKLLQHEANPYPQGEYFVIDCRTYKTFTDIFRRFSRLFQLFCPSGIRLFSTLPGKRNGVPSSLPQSPGS